MTTTTEAPNVASAIESRTAPAAGSVESHLHPVPSWDLADHPVPSGREEIWRFTPVKRLATLFKSEASGAHLEWDARLPDGVTSRAISQAEARELSVEAPVDRISALAHTNSPEGAVLVEIPDEFIGAEPIIITLKGNGHTVFGHVIFSIGKFAELTLVVRFEGEGTFAEKTDVIVGDGAKLNLVTVQDWADGAVHGGQRSVRVGRDAHVKTVTASLGGEVVRLQENSHFQGPGGQIESYGLYFVDAGQHIEHRLFVDHNEPHTKSDVDYRGALQGEGAHSVWIGDVLIRKVAEGIETYEANKNLVLTDGCRADSVPNLEIETGEIAGAGHSSTTGRFDDLQLFYLRSRGITEDEARRLVVHGFFWDIIRRIDVPFIEERMMAQVEKELEVFKAVEAEK
ncbi:Fe-S cluster assembly protein SufD [Tessaracoccus sp. OS52]|uniref:Fe-S cluster assembly protein SufD n=1 Tax=Tessaracoccus sp. OS52 TaxID=2886691 RepID=UPI001D11A945|nr:Fe-S cluster assembly protein SufD [Tessaracoccus sp. OS52]MCC2593339.1 Fe-S cluster assembly protein SufD [Tessaracoccus sp. OS52]